MVFKNKFDFRSFPLHKLMPAAAAVTVMVALAFITMIASATWEVTIIDDGVATQVKTHASTVGELLASQGITLGEKDVCSADAQDPLAKADSIQIKRAFPVTIADQSGQTVVYTACDTVDEVLRQNSIVLDDNDEVVPPRDAVLIPQSVISVAKVDISEVCEDQTIGYQTINKNSDRLEKGKTETLSEGKNGMAKVTYQVVTKNGVETSKNETGREVIEAPVDKVVTVGTKITQPKAVAVMASRGGNTDVRGARVITCRATAYDGSYQTLGKSNPKTALGRTPTVGTVAVDPSVIPLGSRLYIETTDGSWSYGECFAGDTGVSGYHVDLFMGSRSAALSFGSRQVRVYILD